MPIWMYHRYAVEGAASMIGGQDFVYAMRGDGHDAVAREIIRCGDAGGQTALRIGGAGGKPQGSHDVVFAQVHVRAVFVAIPTTDDEPLVATITGSSLFRQ